MDASTTTGLILSRHARDTPQGPELSFWVATGAGAVRVVISGQQPVCFIAQADFNPDPMISRAKPLPLKTLDRLLPVSAVYFDQQKSLLTYRQQCRGRNIRLYESDIKPADRFLMERFIRCAVQIEGTAVVERSTSCYRNPRLSPTDRFVELSCVSLDIETNIGDGSILSIACTWRGGDNTRHSRVLIREHPDWDAPPRGDTHAEVSVHTDERTLLLAFFDWIQQHDPDVIIGWNLIGFDLAFIQKRCADLRIGFNMARGGERASILAPGDTGQTYIAMIPGRLAIDGIEMLRAAFWSFESFSLEFVARELLGKGKLIDDNQDKAAEILTLYQNDPQQLIAYNRLDCELVEDIFEETGLIDFVIQRSQLTGLALGRVGGSVAAFDNLYLPKLHRRGFVAVDRDDVVADIASPGGYVMDSTPGLFENVLVFDFKSLYPSIIRSFLIDPLGLALDDDNQVPGFHNASFSRDNPILPELIGELWAARDTAKQQKNASMSQAIKIIMNSFYGVLGTSACRFHNYKLASSITRRGHEIIQLTRDQIESHGYSVIYGDTDSVFVLLGDKYSYQEAHDRGLELLVNLNTWWRNRLTEEFAIESHLELEFETHFTRFLMPTTRGDLTGSKKRYAGMIQEDGENKLVFKGMESVRSDWTALARDFQRELYQRIFDGAEYKDFINRTVDSLREGVVDQQLSYRKRLRKPLESYVKNVPPHVQAARKSRRKSKWIQYFITLNGPEPADNLSSPLDYDHYIERQLAPAADSLLTCLGTSFDEITSAQLSIF